jgi:hypothetical protein
MQLEAWLLDAHTRGSILQTQMNHMPQLVACKAVACACHGSALVLQLLHLNAQSAGPAPDGPSSPALADLVRLLKDPAATHVELKGDIVFSHDLFPPENANDKSKGINITHKVCSKHAAEPPKQVLCLQLVQRSKCTPAVAAGANADAAQRLELVTCPVS